MSRYPYNPWPVSLFTTPCQRVLSLEDVANDAASSLSEVRAAGRALLHAQPAGFTVPTGSLQGDRTILLADRLLSFVQSVGYHEDRPGEEWFQRPDYTLRHGGDCEDLSTLFVALAKTLGLRARLEWFTQPNASLNHVTSKVWLGPNHRVPVDEDGWAWAETTMRGARLGECPYDALERLQAWHVFGMGAAA